MLIIRKEQMDALGAHMRARFESRMIEHIRNNFPDRTNNVSNEDIRTVMQYGTKKAEYYGIEYEGDIRRFIEYLVIYGTQLDAKEETRWMVDILRRDDLDGTSKMDSIDNCELQLLRDLS